jgi:hypothetical protein
VWVTSDATISPLVAPNPDLGEDPAGIWVLGGAGGLAQVSATADVNLDPATVKNLTAVLDTETVAGEAFAGTINSGALVDQ